MLRRRAIPGRVDRHRKLRDIALDFRHLAGALLVDLVDPNDGVQWQVGSAHILEFGFDFFLRRIDDNGCSLAEYEFLHPDEAEQVTVSHAAGVDFVHLALTHENDFKKLLVAHSDCAAVRHS